MKGKQSKCIFALSLLSGWDCQRSSRAQTLTFGEAVCDYFSYRQCLYPIRHKLFCEDCGPAEGKQDAQRSRGQKARMGLARPFAAAAVGIQHTLCHCKGTFKQGAMFLVVTLGADTRWTHEEHPLEAEFLL